MQPSQRLGPSPSSPLGPSKVETEDGSSKVETEGGSPKVETEGGSSKVETTADLIPSLICNSGSLSVQFPLNDVNRNLIRNDTIFFMNPSSGEVCPTGNGRGGFYIDEEGSLATAWTAYSHCVNGVS